MASQVAPADRGATRIADRVVAKIAAYAAREALDAVPEGGAPPHATVTVQPPHAAGTSYDGAGAPFGVARVRISLELDYPVDIGAQCRTVRRQVTERVRAWAGMEVPEVAVQVERLHSAHTRGSDRERIR
ncbi:Asp23/Gls24 family envelope stress response protein [Streptomyces beihaiensis]|uniref:Asp23/Gls24 family envelope stress response protein n=1 Tax=Streptomyces beihaiensis TaxID=2984495 RepID=A0ABT3TRS9_9ACTN|nr:Asp23/Gls24 family envelope stress response protein [Streptomyces beihaiensis]MCX3059750.1 Asp23/Gls24 family envelope stress response protein [Streptomyces beihaiensis]